MSPQCQRPLVANEHSLARIAKRNERGPPKARVRSVRVRARRGPPLHEETMLENAPPSAGEVRALAQQLLSWADQLALARSAQPTVSDENLEASVLQLALAGRDIARLRA